MYIKIVVTLAFLLTYAFADPKDNNSIQSCNHHLIKILYGKPSPKALKLEQEKKIILGGCVVTENAPKYYCTKCKKKF